MAFSGNQWSAVVHVVENENCLFVTSIQQNTYQTCWQAYFVYLLLMIEITGRYCTANLLTYETENGCHGRMLYASYASTHWHIVWSKILVKSQIEWFDVTLQKFVSYTERLQLAVAVIHYFYMQTHVLCALFQRMKQESVFFCQRVLLVQLEWNLRNAQLCRNYVILTSKQQSTIFTECQTI